MPRSTQQTATSSEISSSVNTAAGRAEDISGSVQRAAATTQSVARTTDELSAGTNEIARNAAHASGGAGALRRKVESVRATAEKTRALGTETLAAIQEIKGQSERIRALLSKSRRR